MGDSLAQWKDGKFRRVAHVSEWCRDWSLALGRVAGDRIRNTVGLCQGYGFFSLDHARWKAWATPQELAEAARCKMYSDSMGLIWVSSYEGNIITMDRGTVVNYPVKPDSPLRNVKAFAEHAPQQIWAGGAGGLALIDSGNFRLMRSATSDFRRCYGNCRCWEWRALAEHRRWRHLRF